MHHTCKKVTLNFFVKVAIWQGLLEVRGTTEVYGLCVLIYNDCSTLIKQKILRLLPISSRNSEIFSFEDFNFQMIFSQKLLVSGEGENPQIKGNIN